MHKRHKRNKINYTKKIRNIILILFIAFISVPISFSKYTSTISEQLSLNIRKPEYDVVYNSNFFPEGYKEVEYIESTGTQYIDTGYIPKTNTKLELTLSFSGEFSPGQENTTIFSSQASQQSDWFGLNFGGASSQNNTLFAWPDKSYYVTGNIESFTITDDIRTNKNTIIMENGKITYGTAGRNITSKSNDQTTNMILFGTANFGNTPIPISAYNMKVFRLKLYENDSLVREYVPCYRTSDNEIGLYELVNNVFYPNNGTGTFNKGNDIETSGTMSNQHFIYNTAQNLKNNKFSRAGYKFNGWNTKIYGTGTSYTAGQSVNNLTTTDNSTINLYAQWTYVGESGEEEEITNKNIIDYDVDLGIDVDGNSKYDWEYFYNDGNNIYIIAEDCIPMNSSLLSNSLGNEKESINIQPYSFFYLMPDDDESIINNGKTGSDELFGNNVSASNKFIPDKYLISWKEKVQNSPTTANNAKFVAMMMDTEKWENFANSTKIKTTLGTSKPEELLATGGPTIEMWVKSWNKKHGNSSNDENKIEIEYECSENGIGYRVREENGEWNYGLDLSSNSEGIEDIMYLPHNSSYNGCEGYWIISPSAIGYNSMMRIGYNGELGQDGCGNWCFGIRPVVCLPSDITAEWNEDEEIWKIKKKTENVEYLTDNDYLIVMASSKSKFEGKSNVGTIEEFRTLVNSGNFNYENAYLYENIELNCDESNPWTSIGTDSAEFYTTLDGRNHEINGLYISANENYQGLFRMSGGTIKNLTINGQINCSASGVGGIVGYNDGTIENCTSNVTTVGNEYIGGIAGYNSSNGTIKKSTSNNSIKGTQIVGGIAGGTDGIIEDCLNIGNVESTSNKSSTISSGAMGTGGITGVISSRKSFKFG